ncbi:putative signal transduction protein [Marinomonas mediterranea MMB-1]|uniref:Putative signal transduction protein n=1 Tax=Marinomonas mediterranea (strain ATCC 700492 / JCM 21426 / NBRC 103028 / MMB-1) TaxID=717774 RepID=F2K448_MARM1|nr:putative signal transduction protein [Marinomonas mediterranea MMB-1]
MRTNFLFCRENIVDSLLKTEAYYIKHSTYSDSCNFSSENSEKSTLINALFFSSHVKDVLPNRPLFIQIPVVDLVSLPPRNALRATLFLKSDELIGPEILSRIKKLRMEGFEFGIVNPSCDTPDEILRNFTSVCFELSRTGITKVLQSIELPSISPKKIWVCDVHIQSQLDKLVATKKVNSFSGPFLTQVEHIKGKTFPIYKIILAELIEKLNNHTSTIRSLADTVERDPNLAFRVIKLTKAVPYHRQFSIPNVQRALEIIGLRDLLKWVTLAMFSSVEGKPDCLTSMALSRAYFCQLLAHEIFPEQQGAFLTGLFSYLPAIFEEDMTSLLESIPLDSQIKDALLAKRGNLGSILKVVCDFEAGRWDILPLAQLEQHGLDADGLRNVYLDSLKQAKELNML